MIKRLFCLLMLLGLIWGNASAQQLGGRAHASNMRFNKLRTGTLANCGTNTFVTGWNAAGTQVCAQITLSMLTDGATVATLTGTQKLTNKQNVLKAVVQTVVTNAITPNVDTTDVAILDAISADLTINAPVGTGGNPVNEQELLFRFLSAVPRALTWNAIFTAENGPPLPTTTTGDGVTYDRFKFIYNSTSAKWGLIASTKGTARGVTTLASSTTLACNADLAGTCEMQMTGATGTITVSAPLGTLTNAQELRLRLLCTNSQTLSWNAVFLANAMQTVPTTCPADTTRWLTTDWVYSSVLTKWQLRLASTSVASTPKAFTTLATSTTFTCNGDTSSGCEMAMTGAAGTLTIAAPTGTPVNGQTLSVGLLCTNLQVFSWNAIFLGQASRPLPTHCPADTTAWLRADFVYSTVLTKWQLMDVTGAGIRCATTGGDVNTSSSGSGADKDHSLTCSIPASFLTANTRLRICSQGKMITGSASPQLTLKFKLGATTIWSNGPFAVANNHTGDIGTACIDTHITAAPGASVATYSSGGAVQCYQFTEGCNSTAQPVNLATNTALTLTFTSRWETAGTGTNSFTQNTMSADIVK
jgi:hypothetical protein